MKAVVGDLFPFLRGRKLGSAATGRSWDEGHMMTLRSRDKGTWLGIPFACSKVLVSKI